MKEHTWIVQEIDGGPIGIGEFWLCSTCGASAGHLGFHETPETGRLPGRKGRLSRVFLAGPSLTLSEDCEESSRLITEYHKQPQPIKSNK